MFEWWWEFLYSLSHALNQCIDALFKLFLFFAGASDAEINNELTGSTSGNPLVSIFTTNSVAIWFAGILGLAIFVFMISIIIAMVRTEVVGKDNKEGKIKIFKNCLKGTMLIVLMPAIFGIAVRAITILMGGIVSAMGTDENSSFAQEIFNICMPDASNKYPWDSSYSYLSALLNSANELNGTSYSMHDYNYFIAFVGGIIMLFILGLSVLTLIERIIDLVFLYIISPVVIAVSPLDEGNRLGIWKDLTIAKLFSIAGMIICFYIYFLFMGIINSLLVGSGFLIGFTKLICAIGGALAAKKGGLLISNLVGHNTAMIEGQQQGLAAQVVGTGFRAGLGVVGALGHSAIHLLGWGGSKVGGAIKGAGAAAAATTAATVGASVAAGAAGAVGTAVNTTFQAISEAFNQQGGAGVSVSPVTTNTATSEISSLPVVNQTNPINGGAVEGKPLTQPTVLPNSAGTPEVKGTTENPSTMPPISGNIQTIINGSAGFNSGDAGNDSKKQ